MNLLHADQNYVIVQFPKGREITVSARDISLTRAGPGEEKE